VKNQTPSLSAAIVGRSFTTETQKINSYRNHFLGTLYIGKLFGAMNLQKNALCEKDVIW